MRLFDLTGDVAAVIGGTGALGGAIASGLADAGARVAVMGRREAPGQDRVDAIASEGGTAAYVRCDATDRDSVRQAREEARERFGPVTILVNAAGGNDPKVTVLDDVRFESIELEAWEDLFRMNLVGGALLPCQEFGPAMIEEGGGSIINIASVTSHLPLSRVVGYSASKAAVLSLTRFLAREWAHQGVRVNSITPGFFPSDITRPYLFEADGSSSPRGLTILNHTPMRRYGSPDELAGAAVYLASKRASGFVTGADMKVDGGFLAMTI